MQKENSKTSKIQVYSKMNPNQFLLAFTLLCLASVEAGTSARRVLRGQVSSNDRQLKKSKSGRLLKKDDAGCRGKGKDPKCNDDPPNEDPDSGEKCGKATCKVGEVCCNPSCNICTPPGGQCHQGMCP